MFMCYCNSFWRSECWALFQYKVCLLEYWDSHYKDHLGWFSQTFQPSGSGVGSQNSWLLIGWEDLTPNPEGWIICKTRPGPGHEIVLSSLYWNGPMNVVLCAWFMNKNTMLLIFNEAKSSFIEQRTHTPWMFAVSYSTMRQELISLCEIWLEF